MEIAGRRVFQEKHNVNGKIVGGNMYCFYWAPRRNEIASQKQGAPVYDRVLMAEIRSPGFKTQIHTPEIEIHFADGTVRQRLSGYREDGSGRDLTWREVLKTYLDAWEKEQETPDDGTPLETWPRLDVAMIAALREAGVYSVEMLAGVPDNQLGRIGMGGRTLRDQAIAYLEEVKGNAQNNKLIAENAELRERMARMEEALAAIKRADAEKGEGDMPEPQKRGPGRPPKNAAVA